MGRCFVAPRLHRGAGCLPVILCPYPTGRKAALESVPVGQGSIKVQLAGNLCAHPPGATHLRRQRTYGIMSPVEFVDRGAVDRPARAGLFLCHGFPCNTRAGRRAISSRRLTRSCHRRDGRRPKITTQPRGRLRRETNPNIAKTSVNAERRTGVHGGSGCSQACDYYARREDPT